MNIDIIKSGHPLTFGERLSLTAKLAWPAIIAQLSSILMQYIDAAMVGRLGADSSAAVGLVSTSLWLFWGVCAAATSGFSVQIAHRLGASDADSARRIFRQGIIASLLLGIVISLIGLAIAGPLPRWLGGDPQIQNQASVYFAVFVSALPILTLNYLASGSLRATGSMGVVGGLNVMMCALDVIFNLFLIFPTREISLWGWSFILPGAGLGVLGAALGTVAAEMVSAACMMWYALGVQKGLKEERPDSSLSPAERREFLRKRRKLNWRLPKGLVLKNAAKVSAPMTLEHAVICGAQIMITVIVAPLGTIAIAANAFAVTAEALCYMPGYGIADAATTLTGQSFGAGRKDLAKNFGYMTVGLGMAIMGIMGVALWWFAPDVMALLSPVAAIQSEGVSALRIEAWAEPMFGAAIVAYGVMVGVGDTVRPAVINFSSIWLIRVPLAAIFAGPLDMGLYGVWLAMCIELSLRGAFFLWRLFSGAWLRHGLKTDESPAEAMLENTTTQ
ncbi:MAG: MATE family efflux transporter [Bacteroidales bacterium]|nr:MATE family efflux transporter [Bacteroidales bacterium]